MVVRIIRKLANDDDGICLLLRFVRYAWLVTGFVTSSFI